MSAPPTRREFDNLKATVDRLNSELRRRPVIDWFGGGSPKDIPIYEIVDAKVSSISGFPLVIRRSDTVLGSEMPAGTGGSPGDIIDMPTLPLPSGLPDGIGVAESLSTGKRLWCVLDARSSPITGDMCLQRRFYSQETRNLDKISGGVTYRYACIVIRAAV